MNISAALVEDIISLEEVKDDMAAVVNALKDDFTRNLGIRTSPGIVSCRTTLSHLTATKYFFFFLNIQIHTQSLVCITQCPV